MNHDIAPLPLDLFAFARWVAFVAAFIAVGSVVFAVVLRRVRGKDHPSTVADRAGKYAWRVALISPVVLLIAHLLRLYGQVRSFLEPGDALTWEVIRPILFSTAWGRGWLTQCGAAIFAGLVFIFARAKSSEKVAGLGAIAVAVASPLTGHAIEHPWGATAGVALHALHFLGASTWLGTLFVLFFAGSYSLTHDVGERNYDFLGRLVRAFSPFALGGAGVAVVAGGLLSLVYIGSLHALWSSTYGKTLLVKVALLGGVAALGAYNWRIVTPGLGSAEGSVRFRGSAAAELALGALLLAATAVLVALPAPGI